MPRSVLIVKAVTAIIVVIAIAVAAYALFYLMRGVPGEFVVEGETTSSIRYTPAPHALAPLFAAVLITIGTLTRKFPIAWFGLGVLITFAALALFGIGGALLPLALFLLILLALANHLQRK